MTMRMIHMSTSITLLLLTACNSSDLVQQAIANPETLPVSDPQVPGVPGSTPTPTPTPTPVPDTTGGLSVVIHKATNFSASERAHLERARVALEKAVNSEEFRQRVLHYTYQGQETYVQNDGYSNAQIYDLIMAGAEQYPRRTTANQTMDFYTELYYEESNVIGYTDPSTSTIYMNSYFFDDAEPSDIAGNMMHEWLHKLGFDHDYEVTERRPYSVPYAIGYIAEALARKY